MKKLLYAILILLFAAACSTIEETPDTDKFSFKGIDESIKPGDNFFMRVNQTWYDSAQIADDQVGVGSYSFLNIPQKVLLENIL